MSTSAKSVYFFGFYLYAIGLALLFIPNQFLTISMLPATNEVWIRVVGTVVLCIAYYYHRSGAVNNKEMIRLTVHARIFVCLAFATLVLLKYAEMPLAGFGLVDLVGAIWTWTALKKER